MNLLYPLLSFLCGEACQGDAVRSVLSFLTTHREDQLTRSQKANKTATENKRTASDKTKDKDSNGVAVGKIIEFRYKADAKWSLVTVIRHQNGGTWEISRISDSKRFNLTETSKYRLWREIRTNPAKNESDVNVSSVNESQYYVTKAISGQRIDTGDLSEARTASVDPDMVLTDSNSALVKNSGGLGVRSCAKRANISLRLEPVGTDRHRGAYFVVGEDVWSCNDKVCVYICLCVCACVYVCACLRMYLCVYVYVDVMVLILWLARIYGRVSTRCVRLHRHMLSAYTNPCTHMPHTRNPIYESQ